jgi:hypothetical protein
VGAEGGEDVSVAEDFAAYRKVMAEHIEKLERENAALREDKERLDYMEKNVDFVSWLYFGKPHSWDFRGKIDAKRKEAQP